MGSYFSTYPKDLKNIGDKIYEYKKVLNDADKIVEEAAIVIGGLHGSIRYISRNLKDIRREIISLSSCSENMGQTLGDIAEIYEGTEKRLLGQKIGEPEAVTGDKYVRDGSFWSWIRDLFGWGTAVDEDEIDSIVFDDSGQYGGDQGDPAGQWGFWSEKGDLYDIVRKHFPDMTDKEIAAFLKKLNSEGCSYVATLNTIFAAFEGREEEFERIFGFPMYKHGDLNYNELLVDFYCETDNHTGSDRGDTISYWEDYNSEDDGARENYDYNSDSTGRGATPEEQVYRADRYLRERGVDVDITAGVDVTVDNFHEYVKDGYVVVDYYNGPLQDLDGNTVQDIGGHGMTITGTTSDGRYIVSSWGEKYYLDPSQGRAVYVYYQYH